MRISNFLIQLTLFQSMKNLLFLFAVVTVLTAGTVQAQVVKSSSMSDPKGSPAVSDRKAPYVGDSNQKGPGTTVSQSANGSSPATNNVSSQGGSVKANPNVTVSDPKGSPAVNDRKAPYVGDSNQKGPK